MRDVVAWTECHLGRHDLVPTGTVTHGESNVGEHTHVYYRCQRCPYGTVRFGTAALLDKLAYDIERLKHETLDLTA